MGKHSNKSFKLSWSDYNQSYKDEATFEAFIKSLEEQRDRSESKSEKATYGIYRQCCLIQRARRSDASTALALSQETAKQKQLLADSSAYWEAQFYSLHGDVMMANAELDQAVSYHRKAVQALLGYYRSHHMVSFYLHKSAKSAFKAGNPDLALTFCEQAVNYAYRFPSLYKQNNWLNEVSGYLATYINLAEKKELHDLKIQLEEQKRSLVYPQPSPPETPTLQQILEGLPGAARPQLYAWKELAKEMNNTSPKSDSPSPWLAAFRAIEAHLASDPFISSQLMRDALSRLVSYEFSPLLLPIYTQSLTFARQANLPGREQQILEWNRNCHHKLYGREDRLSMIAEAQFLNGPLERTDKGKLSSGMRDLLKLASDKYPDDQELRGALTALAPAEALTGLISGEVSPERKLMLEKALVELNGLIGMDEAKAQIEALQQFISVQRRRQAEGEQPAARANHFVFTGPPGTGKTTVARLLGRILYALEQLPSDKLLEVSPSDLVAGYTGQTAIKTREVIERARGGVLFIDEAYQLGSEAGVDHKGFGGEAMAEIILAMENERDSLTVVFAGYQAEMSRFLETNAGLASRVSEIINFPSYEPEQLCNIFSLIVSKNGYRLDEQAEAALPRIVESMRNSEKERFGNGRAMRSLFEDSLLRQAKRLSASNETAQTEQDDQAELSLLTLQDLTDDRADSREQALKEARAELDDLIGLSKVKEQVAGLSDLVAVRREREAADLKNQALGNHLVFAGPPGTGKTTVGRIWAKLLYGLGQLPSDKLVEASRADLVAAYVGQSAIKTRQLVRSARGGVLLIDEAYALTDNSSEHNFGREALTELMKLMEDERDNLAVVLCGYSGKMKKFLEANPGMSSRISATIKFDPYTAKELLEVCKEMLKEADYLLDPGAEEHVLGLCKTIAGEPPETAGNARSVRNMVDDAIVAQASRIREAAEPSPEQLKTLTETDFSYEPSKSPRNPIGFA